MKERSQPETVPLFVGLVRQAPRRLSFEEEQPPPPVRPTEERVEETPNLIEITVQAYAEGFERGRTEGYQATRATLELAARSLLDAAESLVAKRAEALQGAREELVELALCIAGQVIRAEAEAGRGLASRLAEFGISRLAECPHLTVRLNPEDVRSVAETLGSTREGLSLVADPTLSRGGVVVEGEFGKVDARLETQLDEMRRILGARPGDKEVQ